MLCKARGERGTDDHYDDDDDDDDEEISFSSAFKIPTGLKVLTTDNFTCLMCQLGDRRREWHKKHHFGPSFICVTMAWRCVYNIQNFHC